MASEASSSGGGGRARAAAGGGAGCGGGGGGGGGRVLHARSFKLRFAPQREPGRSYVSLVKPLGLPATVTDKWYARAAEGAAAEGAAEEAARRRVRDAFARGPTDKYPRPALTSHEVGWWWRHARPEPRELRHHIRDSPWLRERLRLLPPPPAPAPRR